MTEVLFVGREREKDIYKKFLARETPWVLIITGLGGIGKTTLLHRLVDYTLAEPTLSKTGIVTLDFANEELRNDPLKLLDKLTIDTAPYCDLQQINSEFKKELLESLNQLAQISKERTQTVTSDSQDVALQEIRHQMRELATEAFYLQIKIFKLDRLVIMLDTCEWLNEPEAVEVGQWVLNELIPGIHIRTRQKGRQCSVVMFSRIQPRLDVINGQDQRNLTLPMLGKAEVDQYLEHMGMQDPDLRQRVYEVTHGHALCVSIIGDFWQQREGQEQPFTIADLPELQVQEFSEIALMRFTNERVLRQLKSPFNELTSYGVLLRSFDLPLLRNVFPELLPEPDALEQFNQLIRYPFIESRGNYRYAFHELLREALAEITQKEEPEEWKCYHKRALDYLTQVSSRSPDWYYHLLAYDEKQGLVEWRQAIQEAREGGKREYSGALLQAALDKALKLSPAAHAEIAYEHGRFNYYGVQWEEALNSYKEAMASFEEVENYSGQAKVLHAMGDVQRALGKQDDALGSYEKARALYQQLGDQFGEAKCSQAMGDVRRLRDNLDAALQCYERCLVIFQQLKDKSEEAKVLEAMGDVQRLRNDLDAAQRSYEQALTFYQEEKDRLKRAKVLKTMGDVQRLSQKRNAALESYGQALAFFGELKEPAEEANVRQAIEEMQQPENEQGTLQLSNRQAQQSNQSTSVAMTPLPTQTQPSYTVPQPLPVQKRPKLRTVLLASTIAMIVVLLFSSIFIYDTSVIRPAQLRAQATSAAQSSLTAQAQATVKAETALQNIYNKATGGIKVLDDPLMDNSKGNNWFVGSSSKDSSCQFTRGAYHVIETTPGYFFHCNAGATDFSNFLYQVQMTILKGDAGGIVFRANSANSKLYFFEFSPDGNYDFYLYAGNNSTESQTVLSGSTSSFHRGLNQPNLVAVVAKDNDFYLYVNKQYVATVLDSRLSDGQIGVVADAANNLTEVMFSNAQVWSG